MLLAERTDMILFLCDPCEAGASIGDCTDPVIIAVPNIVDVPEGGWAIECGRTRAVPVVLGPGVGNELLEVLGGEGISVATYWEK